MTTTFDQLIESRMTRFEQLINHAKFDFKQYQHDGVKWCIQNELRPNPPNNVRGGIIADEMGLGKTITMIGTMFANYLQRTLIVVPPVLIHQWRNEILRTSGHDSLVYYGDVKKTVTLERLNSAPIVIATYNALLDDKCLLKHLVWSRLIFDEAHHLRNRNTQRYKACINLRARVRWLVTGTPVQNRKADFHALCAMIGMNKMFYSNDENLLEINHHFILRRVKKDVGINLPPVNVVKRVVPWKSKDEMSLAEEIHTLISNQSFVPMNRSGDLAFALMDGGVLSGFMRSRQSCIMPSLMEGIITKFVDEGLIGEEYLEAICHSSKIDAVAELVLSRHGNGKGKIVFCQFKKEIEMLAERFKRGGMTRVVTYHGGNSGGKALENLGNEADVLIIQIQTGCEGLNLQKNFSEIYFVSPHWNPYVEDQAIGRCHRIGQTEEVNVFRFIMENFDKEDDIEGPAPITMEKYVSETQKRKRVIGKKVLLIIEDEEEVYTSV